MAKREQMASAYDATADQSEAKAGPVAVARAVRVPWGPAEIVCLRQDEWVAADTADTVNANAEEPADLEYAPSPAPSRLRRTIPLLWAAALTVAALQHAGEVERRTAFPEPSSAEVEMQDRSEREIRAAWRNVGAVTAVAETKPAEPIADEKKAEAVMAKQQIEPTAVRDAENKPLQVERPLVEPIAEVTHKAMTSEQANAAKAEGSAPRDIDTAGAVTKGSEPQATADAQALTSSAEEAQPSKSVRQDARVTTSHAPEQHVARASEPKTVRPARARSPRYVELDGQSPRYVTIERPSRGSP
jgi:hypothetical protein